MGKVIHRELSKKFKSDQANKWYMHNPESVLENEMYKLFRDFVIQTDHLISARRQNLVIVIKKNTEKLTKSGLFRPSRSQDKTEGKWKER